jgi:hypothetical protein
LGRKRNGYRLLVGKRPLGRQRHRWADNIKLDFGDIELGRGDIYWIDQAQDRDSWRTIVNVVMNLEVL